ncbi:MAG: cation:proton antiporter [Chitinophagaceae bacterium]|nr:cation:proton antiporter [Chitinophagaceae bacterium]MBK9531970.1 cation:proton antiporter [Chitinophagaceae bacterium]HQW93073.1 cation:proton antiporter [Ferruginibacter sp.]
MKKKWSSLFYFFIVAGLGTVIFWIIKKGAYLQDPVFTAQQAQKAKETSTIDSFQFFKDSFIQNLTDPLAVLLLQIIVIIAGARFAGFLFRKIGQPAVIGEIVAGIILGPSVLGLFFPGINHFLFPAASLGTLNFLSQIGLILFMFIIGMEIDLKAIGKQAYDAVIISHASIIIPYALGVTLAYFIYRDYAPAGTSFLSFGLFMGIAMSITAFPVLARILQEKGLTRSRLGAMALTCAAADDLTAWCILAAVIALVKSGSSISVLYTIGFAVVYVFIMMKGVRPYLERLSTVYDNKIKRRTPIIALLFVILIISSYITSIIGVHALFGAFMAGVIMPGSFSFRKIVVDKIEDVSIILLLPLFFVITGLRTEIGLINEGHLWITFGWILLVAVAGKFGGSALAARMVGQSWKDSLSIGVLMNTRGLMQLIVLNIGYDLGILSPEIFAMMVLMALVTTFMTGPALDLINRVMPEKEVKKNS